MSKLVYKKIYLEIIFAVIFSFLIFLFFSIIGKYEIFLGGTDIFPLKFIFITLPISNIFIIMIIDIIYFKSPFKIINLLYLVIITILGLIIIFLFTYIFNEFRNMYFPYLSIFPSFNIDIFDYIIIPFFVILSSIFGYNYKEIRK